MPEKYKKTAQSLYLDEIKGSELDNFLAMGWYRMGPTIFSIFYIFYENQLLSTIWLRTPLKQYTYSKSLKKLLRKNGSSLTHVVVPFKYSKELDDLYQKYRHTFKGNLPDSLDEYMMNSLGLGIYDTYLVKVYEGEQLIACSIFDQGENTLASIFGFYDPSYSVMSLGLYTMLLEIEYAIQHEMEAYYIGYFIPGNPRFDYKLRVGNIEYLDFKTREWICFDAFEYDQTPIKVVRRKLKALHSKLNETYDSRIYQNAFIDANIIEFFPMKYVDDPVILVIETLSNSQTIILCIYDVSLESYKMYQCQIVDSPFSRYNRDWVEALDDQTLKDQLVIQKTLKVCKTIAPIERWLNEAKVLSQSDKNTNSAT